MTPDCQHCLRVPLPHRHGRKTDVRTEPRITRLCRQYALNGDACPDYTSKLDCLCHVTTEVYWLLLIHNHYVRDSYALEDELGNLLQRHLAGAVAANTILPVIGVPLAATQMNGLDALLATVQMPAGVPVATVAVGKPGARNAGLLAVQILALSDAKLTEKLRKYKNSLVESSREKNKKLQEKLRK